MNKETKDLSTQLILDTALGVKRIHPEPNKDTLEPEKISNNIKTPIHTHINSSKNKPVTIPTTENMDNNIAALSNLNNSITKQIEQINAITKQQKELQIQIILCRNNLFTLNNLREARQIYVDTISKVNPNA